MGGFASATVCCLLVALAGCWAEEKSKNLLYNERRLYHNLTRDLEPSVRPVTHSSDAVVVGLGLTLVRIHDLDERSQKLLTNTWLKLTWKDPQLTWNPSDYDGITMMRIPSTKIWKPDIVLYNMAFDRQEGPDLSWVNVVVDYNGTVLYIPHLRLESTCQLEMASFPYDSHNCSLKFGSWTNHKDLIELQFYYSGQLDLSYYNPHSEWDITSHYAQLNDAKYDCCPETYQDVTFSVLLKRRNAYYTQVFVAPSVILLFVTPTIFWLPPDCHEKMTLGTGVMLGQVLLLVMLENYIPAAHPVVPVIGRYYVFGLVMVALSLILAVMIRNIWSQSNRKRAVPACLRTVVLGLFGRLLCIQRDTYAPLEQLQGVDSYENRTAATAKVASIQATSEWRQLAAVLDRLFFILFVAISVIVTGVMLHY